MYQTNLKGPNSLSTPEQATSFRFIDTCPACAGAGYFRQDVPPGHPQFGKLTRCDDPFHAEDRLSRLARLSGMKRNELGHRLAYITKIHQTVQGRLISNVDMIDAARSLIEEPYGFLYIWGPPGNAKTIALQSIVNELNERGQGPAIYNKLTRLINYMREAFDPEARGGYNERFNQLLSAKVLAIDEMDKARTTEFAHEFRTDFLDERYRQAVAGETVTIFAGNDDPAELPDFIYDRINCGKFKIVFNSAPSARPNEKR